MANARLCGPTGPGEFHRLPVALQRRAGAPHSHRVWRFPRHRERAGLDSTGGVDAVPVERANRVVLHPECHHRARVAHLAGSNELRIFVDELDRRPAGCRRTSPWTICAAVRPLRARASLRTSPTVASRGYATGDFAVAADRARVLAATVHDVRSEALALNGLAAAQIVHGEVRRSLETGRASVELVDDYPELVTACEMNYAGSMTHARHAG